jgi:hypothetical protein
MVAKVHFSALTQSFSQFWGAVQGIIAYFGKI